jgi:lipopolysaccharide export system permease protein
MSKIDWYILKTFLSTFIFCILLFTVIAVAVDSSEKTDDFVKSGLNTAQLIQQYYIGFIPYIWGLLFPLFVFIAVIFFTSRMASRSEIIAILASGTSYNRFLRPYFFGGILLGAILWYANRSVIPKANEIRGNFQATYIDKYTPTGSRNFTQCYNCFYRRSDSNTYIGIMNYDTMRKVAGRFFLERIRDNRVIYNLRADIMRWDTAKNNWKLENVTERIVDSMKETIRQLPAMNINLNIQPGDLRRDYYLKDKLTSERLKRFIDEEELRGTEGLNTLKVEYYRRTATPVTVLILTMIGAIIASRRTRGGSGVHLALGIAIAAVFILSDRFSTVFSINGNLPPIIAAWLPNLIFIGVAYWLYRKTPK